MVRRSRSAAAARRSNTLCGKRTDSVSTRTRVFFWIIGVLLWIVGRVRFRQVRQNQKSVQFDGNGAVKIDADVAPVPTAARRRAVAMNTPIDFGELERRGVFAQTTG